jgi:hypothetical protein
MFIKEFDQLGEIGEGAGEAVDLIDHDNGDLAGPDIGQKLLQRRPVEGGSGEAAIVVPVRKRQPSCAGRDEQIAHIAVETIARWSRKGSVRFKQDQREN